MSFNSFTIVIFKFSYSLKMLHFLSHGVTLVKPLSRQYYTGFRTTFLMSQEFAQMMNFESFSFLLIF